MTSSTGGVTVSCPGSTPVTVPNGTSGTNGTNGTNGQPCTVAATDGGVTVTCPGSNPVLVPNGNDGQDCTVAQVDGGVTVTCPGSNPVTIRNGANGANAVVPAQVEQCLVCHGPSGLSPIEAAHKTPFAPAAAWQALPGAGLKLAVLNVDIGTPGSTPVKVTFSVTDYRGAPVDLAGLYSVNTVNYQPSFSLASVPVTAGVTGAYKVYTGSGNATAANVGDPAPAPSAVSPNPSAFTPAFVSGSASTDAARKGVMVQDAQGVYTYTFPTGDAYTSVSGGKNRINVVTGGIIDPARLNETHNIWIQLRRQWDVTNPNNVQTFQAVDLEYNFIPSGSGTAVKREIVKTSNCSKCHNSFVPEGSPSSQFHSGGRVEAPLCNVCHNPDRSNGSVSGSNVFVHRLHASESLVANPDGGVSVDAFHGIVFPFPQDIRNCDVCHGGAAQGGQAYTEVTMVACGSCHDQVVFATSSLPFCTDPAARDANGKYVACKHKGGAQANDANCKSCHNPTGLSPVKDRHLAVVAPDPRATQLGATADGGYGLPDGGSPNNNTHAAYMAAANTVPPGATVVTYDLKSAALDSTRHPTAVFRLMSKVGAGTPAAVNFGTYNATTKPELMTGFVGGPSVYFAFSVPQDGIAAPSDFNASASCYIKNAWNGTATGSSASACTLAGPDSSGYYTATMTNVVIPASASILTAGVGYTYGISSTRPLTQIDLPAYPYSATTGIGGLIVAAPNVYLTVTGFSARRGIVETARCNQCHAQLGVGPSFHAGQRNDGPTCSFCHNPNRTSSGWSANAKDFVHNIHAGRIRNVAFNWHATSPDATFAHVEFPSNLNNCQACHAPGTYDYSAAAATNALPNMLASTVATGRYNSDPATNPNGWFTVSPYVVSDNVFNYGSGFSFNTTSGVIAAPAATTLVKTPITAACSACHDAPAAVAHMQGQGGLFYQTYAPRQP